MALVPVEIFQQPTGVLGQIIGQGQATIAQALNNLFSVGRDLANNQVRSERDFLSERSRLDSLDQRRAENTQQQSNLDRTFDRNVFQDERNYNRGVEVADRTFELGAVERATDNARQDARDSFNRTDADRRYAILNQDQEAQQAERQRIIDERARTEQFNKDVAAPPSFSERAKSVFDSPYEKAAKAKARADSAKAIGDASTYLDATGDAAAVTGSGLDTAAGVRSERRLQLAEEAAARAAATDEEKKAAVIQKRQEDKAKALVDDKEAFAPQSRYLEMTPDGKGYKDAAKAAEAVAYDKDRFASERAIATRLSREEFISKGGDISPAAKKRRGEFWSLVNGNGSPAAPAASTPQAQSDLDGLLEGL